MEKQDESALTEAWHSGTNWLNEKIDEHFKSAQDHAYALGLKRGRIDAGEAITDARILELLSHSDALSMAMRKATSGLSLLVQFFQHNPPPKGLTCKTESSSWRWRLGSNWAKVTLSSLNRTIAKKNLSASPRPLRVSACKTTMR